MSHCQTLFHALRQRGIRITPQREMIIEALAHGGDHMTAEEVYHQVQARSRAVNIATVYRTLDLLIEAGLVSRILLTEGQQVFVTKQHGPHIHLVCRSCGCILDIDHRAILPLVEQLEAQHGFNADWQHFSIAGLCRSCQEVN